MYSGVARETPMAKCLFAVDELCGFVMACGYVRPTRLEDLEVKSVKKRLKEKSFAAAVDRSQVEQCQEKLGVGLNEFIGLTLRAMQAIACDLGL